ncbi:MAG: hypothetical protein K6T78_08970 [Alicyclobacillus sp.]|nr:hypothetical protein [Alicyclobacillus sp.]
MLNVVSAALTIARCMNGLTIPEVAKLAGVSPDDVFDAENFLEDAPMVGVWRIANVLGVDLDWIQDRCGPLQ